MMEENSKLEVMLGSAREELMEQGGAVRGMPSWATYIPWCQDPRLPWPCPDPGLLSPCQILHLRHQVSLEDDLL